MNFNLNNVIIACVLAAISMSTNAADDEVLAVQDSEYKLTLIPKSYKFFNQGNGKILAISGKFYGVSKVGHNLDVVFNIKASDCISSQGDILIMVENEKPLMQKWDASGTGGFDTIGTILCRIDEKINM